MKRFRVECTLDGAVITAELTLLDDGLHVLLFGGECSHIGAAAMAQAGGVAGCMAFPGHKEQALCEQWALTLSRQTGGCVTVCGGIHYDNATKEQIEAILRVCNEMLRQAAEMMKNEGEP